MGFHASQELARILGESIDMSRQAEIKAIGLLGGKMPASYPTPASIPSKAPFVQPVQPK
jgi:nitrite reductase (cytochrome c-552)